MNFIELLKRLLDILSKKKEKPFVIKKEIPKVKERVPEVSKTIDNEVFKKEIPTVADIEYTGIPVRWIKENSPRASQEIIDVLQDGVLLKKYGVITDLQKKHFLSQVAHESGLRPVAEKGYSLKRAQVVFGRWHPRLKTHPHLFKNWCDIFNEVYGGRLGNNKMGDGCRYRGRGLIQLTGKANYLNFTKSHKEKYNDGIDFVIHPEKLLEPRFAVESALWFWDSHKLNDLAIDDKRETVVKITKKINGGTNGLSDRIHKFQRLFLV